MWLPIKELFPCANCDQRRYAGRGLTHPYTVRTSDSTALPLTIMPNRIRLDPGPAQSSARSATSTTSSSRRIDDSYRPFLDVFGRYESLKIVAAHQRLADGMARRASPRVRRSAGRAGRPQGRIEILGGAFFEPILAMIPSRDRVGQIRSYTRWLQNRLGATVRGMWMPERVWEQSFTRDLVDAGIEYTGARRLPLQERRPDRVATAPATC